MISYHVGEGQLIELASHTDKAEDISFYDSFHLGADNVQEAIVKLKNYLEGYFDTSVNKVYVAVINKGVIPRSRSIDDIVDAINNISTSTTHTGTFNVGTTRANQIDMGASHSYRYVNTGQVSNLNTGRYSFPVDSIGSEVDLNETNIIRYVDATNVYTKGYDDGFSQVGESVTINVIAVWGKSTGIQSNSITAPNDGYVMFVGGDCDGINNNQLKRFAYQNDTKIWGHDWGASGKYAVHKDDVIKITIQSTGTQNEKISDSFTYAILVTWLHQ